MLYSRWMLRFVFLTLNWAFAVCLCEEPLALTTVAGARMKAAQRVVVLGPYFGAGTKRASSCFTRKGPIYQERGEAGVY